MVVSYSLRLINRDNRKILLKNDCLTKYTGSTSAQYKFQNIEDNFKLFTGI